MFKKTTVIYILFLSGNSFMQSRRGKHDGLTSRSAARIVSAEPPDRADSDRAEISPAPKSAGMFCTRHTHFAEDRFPLRQAVPRQNQINLVLRSACTLCGDKPRLDRLALSLSSDETQNPFCLPGQYLPLSGRRRDLPHAGRSPSAERQHRSRFGRHLFGTRRQPARSADAACRRPARLRTHAPRPSAARSRLRTVRPHRRHGRQQLRNGPPARANWPAKSTA